MIEMAESSALNSDSKVGQGEDAVEIKIGTGIKKEVEVTVKPEPQECVVCVSRSLDCYNMYETLTASGASLHHFLCKFTHVDLAAAQNCSKLICKACLDLINVLEQAEIEYVKLKETFEAIINKNPLFESSQQPISLTPVKAEIYHNGDKVSNELDSEDEPLAHTKRKKPRKEVKRKKKSSNNITKRKVRTRNETPSDECRWQCEECGLSGEGGAVMEAAHKLSAHTLCNDSELRDVKTEDSADGSQSPYLDNSPMETCLKIEFDQSDDHSSTETSESVSNDKGRQKKSAINRGKSVKTKCLPVQKKKKTKVEHQCDQCDAKYTSWIRMERHKLTHDGSKPPYICEVCGAHYKHKRACDIHIALHKGISNWKCEECDKLFPSKSALQRHNNIHTGKLNYQCDLCGKSFIHTSSFKMHKLSHSGLKPHSCDVCGLALMTRSHLKRHKRVHSGEKRHECPICGKRFSERYNLAAHSRSHEAPAAAAGRTPARRLFRCPYCPERYERRYMLERHTAQAHNCPLERPQPTPRNTMSKLLKAQAQRRAPAPPSPKGGRSPPPAPAAAPKPPAQPGAAALGAAGSWSGVYAAEFGLRGDFPH